MKNTTKTRKKSYITGFLTGVLLLALVAAAVWLARAYRNANPVIRAFAVENRILITRWPDELTELLEKNPETEEFVLQYPLQKDASPQIDLTGQIGTGRVPLLMQWDPRWGYSLYAGELMGLSGCGPTCLSMVCLYLLEDPACDPGYIAAFAEENGYSVEGSGSAWTLISEGGEKLGLEVDELPLDAGRIVRNLEAGNPIICVLGPGDFTTTGHFIVLTGYENGMVTVNDPNSGARSAQLWDLEAVMGQIRNLWVCRA